jgi:glycosyltransferase involved in cell wall biosynthesis
MFLAQPGVLHFPVNVSQPLVSVVTPSFNRVAFLRESLESVQSQDYGNFEHIVIDGGSTDGTLDVLRGYGNRIRLVSEPDLGYADALNKGFRLARGEILAWMMTDDVYLPGAISRAVEILSEAPDLDMFYGTCLLIGPSGEVIGKHSTKSFSVKRLIHYDPGFFTTQSMFFRKRVLDRAGLMDVNFRLAADYEWLIRVGLNCRVEYRPECLGAFRRHDSALQAPRYRQAYRREVLAASRRHGGYWFSPFRYRIADAVPAAHVVLGLLGVLKKRLVRTGLAPDWL